MEPKQIKELKELMAAMERAGIKKLMIKEKTGYEIHLEMQDSHPHFSTAQAPLFSPPHAPPAHAVIHSHPAAPSAHVGEKPGNSVLSPMVGTLYSSPSPEDPPFVKVGDRVEANTIVCIIEAMKVMNEVKAGISGVVAEVLVSNGHPVEFGTKLFRIT